MKKMLNILAIGLYCNIMLLPAIGAETDSLTQLGIKGFNDTKLAHRIDPVEFEAFGEAGNLAKDLNSAVTLTVGGYSTIGFYIDPPRGS